MSIATRSDLVINEIENISNDDGLSMPTLECIDSTEYESILIGNFGSIIELNEKQICLKSRIFLSGVVPEVNWRMCISPRDGNLGGTTNVCLFMEVTSTSRNKKFLFTAEHKYIIKSQRAGVSDWESDNFKVADFPHPDNPIVRCNIVHWIYVVKWKSHLMMMEFFCKEESVKPSMDDVFHYINYALQFKEAYESSDKADCEIICEGEVLKVHKFMLISHSSVFYAMFEHKKTKEAEKNTIEIVDVELQTLNTMIDYIYSGTIPELLSDDEIIDLIQLADKYDIQSLNHLCQDRLIPRLTELNVCELLKVSEACKAQSLLDACIRLVTGDLKHIVESKKWSKMKNTYPKLLCHVMKQAIKYES